MMPAAEDDSKDIAHTGLDGAREMLKAFCENGFDGSIEAAALALGRDDDEIQEMLQGDEQVDEDLIMKLSGIAYQRDIDIGVEFAE